MCFIYLHAFRSGRSLVYEPVFLFGIPKDRIEKQRILILLQVGGPRWVLVQFYTFRSGHTALKLLSMLDHCVAIFSSRDPQIPNPEIILGGLILLSVPVIEVSELKIKHIKQTKWKWVPETIQQLQEPILGMWLSLSHRYALRNRGKTWPISLSHLRCLRTVAFAYTAYWFWFLTRQTCPFLALCRFHTASSKDRQSQPAAVSLWA